MINPDKQIIVKVNMLAKNEKGFRILDITKAKIGDTVIFADVECILAAGPDSKNYVVVQSVTTGEFEVPIPATWCYEKPLAYVEGKPVYPGDILWSNFFNFEVLITGLHSTHASETYLKFKGPNPSANCSVSTITWNFPPVKRQGWINIYPPNEGYWHSGEIAASSYVFHTEAEAHSHRQPDLISTVKVEWYEPRKASD